MRRLCLQVPPSFLLSICWADWVGEDFLWDHLLRVLHFAVLIKSVVLNWGWLCPHGTFGKVWRQLLFSQLERGIERVEAREAVEQPPKNRSPCCPPPSMDSSVLMSTALRCGKPWLSGPEDNRRDGCCREGTERNPVTTSVCGWKEFLRVDFWS